MTTTEIVHGVVSGNTEAEEALFALYYKSGLSRMRRRLADRPEADCEALVQNVLLEVWLAIIAGRIENPDKLNGYVSTALANEAHEYTRARKNGHYQFLPRLVEVLRIQQDLEADAIKEQQYVALREAMALLTVPYRSVLDLVLWGEDATEHAVKSGRNVNTSKVRKYRAIRRVRILMGNAERQTTEQKQLTRAKEGPGEVSEDRCARGLARAVGQS